ncbi:response regulator [Kutzneria sp. CA-103260]|uniref:response regulator n=1 Tax=Kutzneria sp. CA-103260 TaxID=2802641 RepID=UPI001BA6962A|nr:response regulator [Kutzneria sp. CA-103260]QUQ67182.1 DNA-binding response regulator [Kutzneria sp. CA-103260]
MAENYLRRDGFRVVTALDARSAAAVLREHDPDLMVLDLGLPNGNGLDLLRGVRAGRHLLHRNSLLVAVSGFSQDADRELSRAAGFDAHFAKPLDLADLDTLLAQGVTGGTRSL